MRGKLTGREALVLAAAATLTLGLRLYLARAGSCVPPDGVRYLQAASSFARGDWRGGLASFYPPGYPAAIAGARFAIANWERAGIAVSLASSVLLLLPLAALLKRAGLSPFAFAAAMLGMAICPYPARYAATVRSESLYGLLFLLATWLGSLYLSKPKRIFLHLSGALIGLSYLVRPEGLGLAAALAPGLALASKRSWHGWLAACWEASQPALVALMIASPYMVYLRADTGHWLVSRKTSHVLSMGIREATGRGSVVPQEASAEIGVGQVLREGGSLWLRKLVVDLPRTLAAFAECLHFVYVPFLLIGLVECRRRRLCIDPLVHSVVWFYLALFVLILVNRRFYAALVPLAMIWCGVGFESAYRWMAQNKGGKVAPAMAALVFALILAKGLRVSQCQRYLRAFGDKISERAAQPVVARDPWIAFYAGAPEAPVRFPIDAHRLRRLLARGNFWLVALDDDLTVEAWQLIEHTQRARLAMRLGTQKGGSAHLYHLGQEPGDE